MNSPLFIVLFIMYSISYCQNKEDSPRLTGTIYHYQEEKSSSTSNNINANQIKIPSIEEIKKDLLYSKLGSWTFAKLEEFESVEIDGQQILNSNVLQLELDLELNDYQTGEPYDGVGVIVSYGLKSDNRWHFIQVTGTIEKLFPKGDKTPRITRTINFK